ncbi:MAG: thioredoxin domain-containing protein [Alphaproteobacteria bacterium]|nr:thioredoxin domain-containing protein [Alphaproteobacteria bacterium]
MASNHLAHETSPYLLQHADNPVDWYPWGPEALGRAKRENKPILLSIGYAACHWCHVMAHESFEHAETAALMNRLFVNVKVDREERPDLDTIYQHALQLLGQQGGWPLTMFLTPEGKPFWGGTYFPPEQRWGRPSFRDVLTGIADVYRAKPDKIAESTAGIAEGLAQMFTAEPGQDIADDLPDRAALRLVKEFDKKHGGIGSEPKFPNPSILDFVWRGYKRTGNTAMRAAVTLTLDKMSQGGIYDHLGGGYARYSTDAAWLVPHFEKMLYDNAQLIHLLLAAWQDTGRALYLARIRETVGWVLREMIADGGAFASSLDADSEGEEGRFYVWTEAEIEALLGTEAAFFKAHYDVAADGNWEGHTILNRTARPDLLDDAAEARLARARGVLLAARAHRVRPGWDDKVLADWNGLMIAALANAGRVVSESGWIAAAQRAFRFVAETMVEGGRLRHSWRAGRLRHAATLDDYANMARAALALGQATGDAGYLEAARGWIATLDRHYWDARAGGYFFTADDAEALILRTKTAFDNATPAGNGIAASVIARLYYLTGEDAYRARAAAIVRSFSGEIARNFSSLGTLFEAHELLTRATQVVVVGRRGEAATDALLAALAARSVPTLVLQVVAPGAALPASHPAHGKGQIGGRATAYVCVGTTCSLPLADPDALRAAL